ncbi:GntR family transcriptional regulator [Pseudonocardia sp. NPDC049635]|uniref:GntR family transcriptional regulator n=1 Tax=Pseudonocardia sp. NPDC049635 TaxID=3155506 RepID=UPI0033E4286A
MKSTQSDRTLETLRDLILRGELVAGSRLGEAELAARLDVSRTPVREALGRLAAEGLIELVPHRGARVRTWTAAELAGLFDVRQATEPRLAALAADRITPEETDELARLSNRMLRSGPPGPGQDLEELAALNRRFHGLIVAAADSPALAAALAGAVRPPVVLRNFHRYDDDSLHRSLAHHEELVAALRVRDGDWAAAVMVAHLRNARAVMLRSAS